MKKSISLFASALLMLAVSCHAGEGQKSAKRSAQAAPPYATAPFDTTLEKVPRGYMGHDTVGLGAALLKNKPKKGEYETSSEFDARYDAWKAKPLVGTVKIGDTIAIREIFYAFDKQFNADNEMMTLSFNSRVQTSADDGLRPFINLHHTHKKLSSVAAKTRMGVKFTYTRDTYSGWGVKLINLTTSTDFQFKVPRDTAKGNERWSVLLIGELREPFTFYEESYHEPTLVERYEELSRSSGIIMKVNEIWIFENDGTILTKIPVAYQ